MPLEILEVHFDCAGSQNQCGRERVVETALSLWHRAHFQTWWSLFVAGARETSCFGAPKSTFRDRCKGSERLDFETQILREVPRFGHGSDLRGALISWQVR